MSERARQIQQGVIEAIKKHCGSSRIILFGSRAKGNEDQRSDFDFAIDCKKPDISARRQITESIERVSGLYKVDVVYLQSVEEGFKNIILKTGRVVYEGRD